MRYKLEPNTQLVPKRLCLSLLSSLFYFLKIFFSVLSVHISRLTSPSVVLGGDPLTIDCDFDYQVFLSLFLPVFVPEFVHVFVFVFISIFVGATNSALTVILKTRFFHFYFWMIFWPQSHTKNLSGT